MPFWGDDFEIELKRNRQVEFAVFKDKDVLVGIAYYMLDPLLESKSIELELDMEPEKVYERGEG